MTEIVKYETMDELERLGKAMASSGYFQDARQAAQAVVKILAGREMGFGPVAAMTGIHIIQGKPTIGANLMAAAVKAHPHYDYRVKVLTAEACELEFYQDGKSIGVSTLTMGEVRARGLNQEWDKEKNQYREKYNWKSYPQNMLFARAISNGVRWFCPDVFMGNAVYTPDEFNLEDGGEQAPPEIVVEKPVEPPAPEPPAESELSAWMDAQADAPDMPELATVNKWPDFCREAIARLGYDNMAHVLNAYRQEIGDDAAMPYHTTGAHAGQMIGAAEVWSILVKHQAAKA